MTGTYAPDVVAVEVLVEQDQITPMRIVGKTLIAAVTGAFPVRIREEQGTQPATQLLCDFQQVQELP